MSTSFTNLTGFSPDEFAVPPNQRMGEEEYVKWVIGQRIHAEWIEGEVVYMSPANREHNELGMWLMRFLGDFVDAKDLGAIGYDMLVRLSRRRRYRIPDIFFVTKGREHIIGETMLLEPPDLVIEIVSPDSSARDWREKYLEYEEFGIREYWVIDPQAESFEIYSLDAAGTYQHVNVVEGLFHSTAIAGLWIRAEWFAPAHRPTVKQALAALGAL